MRNREEQWILCIVQRGTIIFEGPNRKIFRLRRATGCRNSSLLVQCHVVFYMRLYWYNNYIKCIRILHVM